MSSQAANNRSIIVGGSPRPELLDDDMIRAVVHAFYAAIRQDDLVGPIFDRVIRADDWPRHLSKMCDFWSATLLRTGRYDGRPLPPHLAIPELEEKHFRRWLILFRQTVMAICPLEVALLFMDRALRIAHSFRLAIAFSRGEDTVLVQPIVEQDLLGSA